MNALPAEQRTPKDPRRLATPAASGAQRCRAGAGILLACAAALLGLPGCLTGTWTASPLPDDAIRPVVAVSSFENRSGFAGEWQIGNGMADLLVSEIVLSRNFVVVERQHLDSLVDEIHRQKDAMFRPEGKVATGKLKNAQYLVRGVINDFSQVGGGALSIAWRWLVFGGRAYNARVSLTLTIVDVESGEIVNAVQCAGTARAREAYGSGAYKGVAFGGDAFFRTPLGVATRNAIREGVTGIAESMPRTDWKPMIAALTESRIVLNGGHDRGYREGQVFAVREAAKPITDPATGDVLTYLPGAQIGVVKVVQVDKKIAFAEIAKGSGFKRGQFLSRE